MKRHISLFLLRLFSLLAEMAIFTIVRTAFVDFLGIGALGLHSFFYYATLFLSVFEMGLSSVVMLFYQKTASESKKLSYLRFLSFYERILGIVILVGGILVLPLFYWAVDSSVSLSTFSLYGALWVLSYTSELILFNYHPLQKQLDNPYMLIIKAMLFTLLKGALQIFVLVMLRSYLLFIIIQAGFSLSFALLSRSQVKHLKRPALASDPDSQLTKEEKKAIWKMAFQSFLMRLQRTLLFSLDFILIAVIVGLDDLGLYSNYAFILAYAGSLFSTFVKASNGRLNIESNQENETKKALIKASSYVAIYFVGMVGLLLVIFFNPLITTWLGAQNTLPPFIVLVISINFVLISLRNVAFLLRPLETLTPSQFWAQFGGLLINFMLSIGLGFLFGMVGILVGTTVSALSSLIFKPGTAGRMDWLAAKRQLIGILIMAVPFAGVWVWIALSNGLGTWGGTLLLAIVVMAFYHAVWALMIFTSKEVGSIRTLIWTALTPIRRKKT